jgi:hypothetical protein
MEVNTCACNDYSNSTVDEWPPRGSDFAQPWGTKSSEFSEKVWQKSGKASGSENLMEQRIELNY